LAVANPFSKNGLLALCMVPKTYVMIVGDNIFTNEKHLQKYFSNQALHLYTKIFIIYPNLFFF
jgi:hypothetical protein